MNACFSKTAGPLRVFQLNSMLTGGGTDDQSLELAAGLQQLGAATWLAGPGHGPFSKLARDRSVRFVPISPEGPLKLRFILAAARLIRQLQIQIVHAHHGRDYWPALLAGRLSGLHPKIVLTRHLAKSPRSWLSRRYLLGNCDALVAVSNFVATVLRQGCCEPNSPNPERRYRPAMRGDHSKIHVILGGIDAERFHPFDASGQRAAWKLAAEHYIFGMVGGYDLPRGKGQREFLAAAAQVRRLAPHARFLIIGRGDMASVLQSDIARLGLDDSAFLAPYCDDMPQAMNAIDCLVHPQIGTEAFGLVLLEAFACGTPVIASDLDGIPEAFAIGGYGQLIPPKSISALARAMSQRLQHPRGASERRWQLHARVAENNSARVMAANVLALYRDLQAAPRAPANHWTAPLSQRLLA